MPVSAVLADDAVMMTLRPGQHGSTFGGNPLACRVATEALKVLVEENLAENAQKQGERFRKELRGLNSPIIQEVRGQGLLNAVVIEDRSTDQSYAWDICVKMANLGKENNTLHFVSVGSCVYVHQSHKSCRSFLQPQSHSINFLSLPV